MQALEKLQKVQDALPEPDDRITRSIGAGFKDKDLGVKMVTARVLAVGHDPTLALKDLGRGMSVAAKDLGSGRDREKLVERAALIGFDV